uniref:Uncharacterized protein n=1 Tax=Grammatophora oceanica TaxID=210454 RepID=A0A7S1VSZ3_9STRA|mmetsp:Transcript_53399/g.79764  ORF Transcript_53399/g.79764 Transcript_53399/m.79764 type:complete len:337 (+) Transcript_53399:128-1138(+)|eukprot:CAMPEP_0194028058 /NCGR_PEP_ID=MMETSP0009_2-20130614/2088_1 /TAXON_ID=210454 /ORGANISM="Grammatophora oceanica, Strain CCMP 410" /LENGTH=336 /DNA_ID=CAMNT_0038667317 /DNA_START=49 /DNA_END=1059 /DNA_ORIENTATION=-
MAKVKNEAPKKAAVNSKDEITDEKLHESSTPVTGRPPSHSVELVMLVGCGCLILFPHLEEIDEVASVRILSRRIFAESVSVSALAYARFMIAVFIFGVSLQLLWSEGWVQVVQYKPGSKLKKCNLVMKGWKTMCPFTSVSWNLLGLYNLLAAIVAYQVALGRSPSPALMRLTVIIWETAAPCTLLVASVIRYAIWPNVIKQGGSTANLKHPRTLIMHNANVLIALTEIALLGGLPLRFSEMALAPLYGILYVVFSWSMRSRWAAPENGPQFLYFFFDTTQGWTTSIALIVLLVVLLVFYVVMALSIRTLNLLGGESLLWHLAYIVGVCSLVCRVRD